jgi:hypothetical protein
LSLLVNDFPIIALSGALMQCSDWLRFGIGMVLL